MQPGSAIDAAAKPTKPRLAKMENLSFSSAVDNMRAGEKAFRRSGVNDERWPYWESIKAYMVITGGRDRIDVVCGITGNVVCHDWRPDLESIEAVDWFLLK